MRTDTQDTSLWSRVDCNAPRHDWRMNGKNQKNKQHLSDSTDAQFVWGMSRSGPR